MSEKIFICYRRTDAQPVAGRLRDSLVALGEKDVFRDKDSIQGGEDWTEAIQAALMTDDVIVLALIGRSWAKTSNEAGIRRLDDPADWNRVELELAIKGHARIIPLLIEDAKLPEASDLPESLRPILKLQTRNLRDADWNADVRRILDTIGPWVPRGDRLSSFVENTPHPAYIFNKVRIGNKEQFVVVECNQKIKDLLDLDSRDATEPEMQKAFREIVHPIYRKHLDFMQSYYLWQVIKRKRPALHHPTFLRKPRAGGTDDLWSADIYSVNLGPGGYLCIVFLQNATPQEMKDLKSGKLPPEETWIPDNSEYYASEEYEAYKRRHGHLPTG